MKKICIFGDSHSRYFEVNKKLLFHAPWLKDYDIDVHKIPASSIIGLGKKRSKLNVAKEIQDHLQKNALNVFCFGQVDMELGYYFKKIVKKELWDLKKFADYLLKKYVEFIKGLDVHPSFVCVKGLNLTVLKYQDFALSYTKRIILENVSDEAEVREMNLVMKKEMESFSERNSATLYFNASLKKVSKENGWEYFDVNDFISGFNPGKGVLDSYIPASFDHHLTDTIEVRKLHLKKLVSLL